MFLFALIKRFQKVLVNSTEEKAIIFIPFSLIFPSQKSPGEVFFFFFFQLFSPQVLQRPHKEGLENLPKSHSLSPLLTRSSGDNEIKTKTLIMIPKVLHTMQPCLLVASLPTPYALNQNIGIT